MQPCVELAPPVELVRDGDDRPAEPLLEQLARHLASGLELRERLAGPAARGDQSPLLVEDELPRLFERFYRADAARASRGTGLGLAIVKHIVTAAGGTVEARGGPGRGVEIRCAFPP